MIENVILVFVLIAVGSLSKKFKLLPEGSSHILNTYVLNIALPAIILISIPKLPISGAILYPVITHWVLYALSLGLMSIFGRIFKLQRSQVGALFVVACLGNTAFLGIPMVKAYYGTINIPYGVLYDQLGSGLAFIVTASFILPKYKEGETGKSLKTIFTELLVFPPFVALVLGFVFIAIPMPKMLENTISSIAMSLIPCAMISVGFQMKYRMEFHKLKPVIIGLGVKLVLIQLIAVAVLKLSGIKHDALNVSVLQSGMPPMITAGAMAMNAGLEEDISASLVGYGLFASFVTLPIIQLLINS